MRIREGSAHRREVALGSIVRLGLALLLLTPLQAFAQADHTTKIRWNADSTSAQIPASRSCNLVHAVFDTADKAEGAASMKFTSPTGNNQDASGCQNFEQLTISDDIFGGDWVCHHWSMKFDRAFNWYVNQAKFKANRTKSASEGAFFTAYLKHEGISVDECSECRPCGYPSNECGVTPYDFDPKTNPSVTDWQSYTWGVKQQSAPDAGDGQTVLWVNGREVARATGMTFRTTNSGVWMHAGSIIGFMMAPYPQSPDGTIWLDDFEVTVGPSECTPHLLGDGGYTGGNRAPSVQAPGAQVNVEGDRVDLLIAAGDPDGDALTFSATNLPPGLVVDPDTGLISGTMAPGSAGVYDVGLAVDDGALRSHTSWTWTVSRPGRAGEGIASRYPGDAGIESDPAVILVEQFEEDDISAVISRWTHNENPGNMSLVADVPDPRYGSKSLELRSVGGSDSGSALFMRLAENYDKLYFRFYVKYDGTTSYHHSGGSIGGYNPPTNWPQGGSGVRPTGSDRFTINAEPNSFTRRLDFYTYWMGMHCITSGCWGNHLINDESLQVPSERWMEIEVLVKMNDPVDQKNGLLAMWVDGEKVADMGPGYPTGTWSGDNFLPGSGSGFEGFQWRNTKDLGLNWIWLSHYVTTASSGEVGRLWFDHVVVATDYIGPLSSGIPNPPYLH